MIIFAYTISYGLFQLVYGPLGDRIGKLKVITIALAAFAVGTAVSLFAFSLYVRQGMGAALSDSIVGSFGYIYCFILVSVAIALLFLGLVNQKQNSYKS